MKRILIISPSAVHNKISHAGGKTINAYLSFFLNDPDFYVGYIYTGDDTKDYQAMASQFPKLPIFCAFRKKILLERAIDGFRFKFWYPFLKKINPKNYITQNFIGKRIKETLEKAKQANFYPDAIITEYTDTIFWVDLIKKAFPKSVTIASCHDITYLSVKRALVDGKSRGFFGQLYYRQFKKLEISHLSKFNLIVTQSNKDTALLKDAYHFSATKIDVISPYFDNYQIDNQQAKDYIVFFGAMGRLENIDAAEWFLNNVWLNLDQYFKGTVKYVIVGGGISKEKRESLEKFNNVIATGFIENPEPIFSSATCFVVPLRLGAGIKVKVLEAMKAGIPVLTNAIGIEGIPATNQVDYIHCEQVDDYIKGIKMLYEDTELQRKMGRNARQLMDANFSLEESYKKYREGILTLLK